MKLLVTVLAVLHFGIHSLANADLYNGEYKFRDKRLANETRRRFRIPVRKTTYSAETKLRQKLFANHTHFPYQRPIRNVTDVVDVRFGVALIQIYELDERAEKLISHVWIRQLWADRYLQWEPAEFEGVTTLRVPSDDVWKPDITLYNGPATQDIQEANAVIYNSGDVLYIPAGTLVSMCELDLTKFPFDEQTCVFKFGSWSYDKTKVSLDYYEGQDKIDMSDHVGNKAWDVMSTTARIYDIHYPCCWEPFAHVDFNITIRRKTTYYHYVFVTPAVMLALLCPVLFLLPSDDTGKFPLGGTLLVTLAIFFSMLEDQLPVSHNTVPVIGVYYTVVFVLISLSLAISAVTSNIANRATRLSQPSNILKTILLSCLGRVLCVPYDSTYGVGISDVNLEESDPEKRYGKQGKGVAEWRLMAMVLDRIFFILFLIIVILTTLVLLA